MRYLRILKKIEAGRYEAYTSGASDPFALIVKICSRRWRVYDLFSGRNYDFDTFTQCKSFLGID